MIIESTLIRKIVLKQVYKIAKVRYTKSEMEKIVKSFSDIASRIDNDTLQIEDYFMHDLKEKNSKNKITSAQYYKLLMQLSPMFNSITSEIYSNEGLKLEVMELERNLRRNPKVYARFFNYLDHKIINQNPLHILDSLNIDENNDKVAGFAFYLYHICIIGRKTKEEDLIYKTGFSPSKINILMPSFLEIFEDSNVLSEKTLIKKYGVENVIKVLYIKERNEHNKKNCNSRV